MSNENTPPPAPQVVRIHNGDGWVLCILVHKRNYPLAIVAGTTLTTRKIPGPQRMVPIIAADGLHPYPVKKAARSLLGRWKRHGGTQAARAELKELLR